jgi:D-alanyl-D-alanine carboxypeptidase/D-alanyl-D-alanine-endopeptidase (penicillin-binding protein 4)
MVMRTRLSLLLTLLAATPALADVAALNATIDAATADARRYAFVSILVRSLTRGDTLYRRDSERVFVPASNQKLLTSATALDRLGSDYRFVTRVLTLGERSADGTLHGDLILQGGGNPILATADLKRLARQVAESGIRHITGALRADESRFDARRLGRGWAAGDEPYYYSAQISALSLNRNTITVRIAPGTKRGSPANVSLEPTTAYVRVRARCTTGAPGSQSAVALDRVRARNEIQVTGSVPLGGVVVTDSVTVENPALYAAWVFRDALREAGVTLDGPVVWLSAPRAARPLVAHDSPPLAEIVALLNKPSDNMIAEMLLKAIGAERRGSGTAAAGAAEVASFLREAGVDAGPLVISDGSGLSRMNLVSPETLCALLEYMNRHRDADVFRRSLPIAAIDGTLRRRMLNSTAANNARAKTGTLTHVSALSGYVTARNGETLVFSIMTNNHPAGTAPAKEMENAVCRALAEFSR